MAETGNSTDNIVYRIAQQDDYNELYVFLNRSYVKDEPMMAGIMMEGPVPEEIVYTLSLLGLGASVVAVDKRYNKIIGCAISGAGHPTDIEHMHEEITKTANKKSQQLLKLYIRVHTSAGFHVKHHIEKTLHVNCLSTDPAYRGLGIGEELLRRAYAIGKEQNYPFGSIDCSSFYSARIAERLNMKRISSIAYEDILDEDGQRLFCPPPPHTHIQSFILEL